MRRLLVWVPRDQGNDVVRAARAGGATHAVAVTGAAEGGPVEVVFVHAPNDRVDDVLAAMDECGDVRASFEESSASVIEPPREELPDQVTDVSSRSPLQIVVGSLQNVGSWPPFLAQSAVAGAVVWSGLATNTVFLLTAAMLIAPYAGPVLAAALGTARGDAWLVTRSVGRYAAAVATSAAVAALLTVVTGLTDLTELMVQVADVPFEALVLPVAAGVAGTVNMAQPERTNLSAGAGVGMLVALALAPQAGLIGVALVLGDGRVLASAAFVAVLQLVAVNLVSGVAFTIMGVRPRAVRLQAGSGPFRWLALGASAAAVAGLLALQLGTTPELTRETLVVRSQAVALAALDEIPGVVAVDVVARFPMGQDDQLVVEGRVLVPDGGVAPSPGELVDAVRERLAEEVPDVELVVGVSRVDAAAGTG